jgi:hypothetical protein
MSTQAEPALKNCPRRLIEPAQKNFFTHAQHAFPVTQAAVTQTAAVTTEISNSKDDSNNMTTHNSRNAGRVYIMVSCAASGHVYTTKGCAAPAHGRVYTTEAGAAP